MAAGDLEVDGEDLYVVTWGYQSDGGPYGHYTHTNLTTGASSERNVEPDTVVTAVQMGMS